MTMPRLPANAALFLDFDGTLVDIAPRPDAVVVLPHLSDLLTRVCKELDGAFAIVSGRPIAEIDRFLDTDCFRVGGLHGLEWRQACGQMVQQSPAPRSLNVFREQLLERGIANDGVTIEDKSVAIAVHYRANPSQEDAVRGVIEDLLSGVEDLVTIEGKMVFEVKPRAISKGTVVQRFLSLPAFEGRIPVFVGDDTTDEDGMRAAAGAGGFGIKVGDGESCASYRLQDVADVHKWLADLVS
ncbi:trehalose-phosphatase [Hartmannibacter diazotrophicus]|nr:trehalose-phosphatase [Hartmannibacter diazotrophicus]